MVVWNNENEIIYKSSIIAPFGVFLVMFTKFSPHFCKLCILVPFTDSFICKRFIPEIPIMFFLKDLPIEKYWYNHNKLGITFIPFHFFSYVLTEKFTYGTHEMTYNIFGVKTSSDVDLYSKKKHTICDFSFFAMSQIVTFLNILYSNLILKVSAVQRGMNF